MSLVDDDYLWWDSLPELEKRGVELWLRRIGLPVSPDEYSTWEAKALILDYAKTGLPLPSQLVPYLEEILGSQSKPSRKVSAALNTEVKRRRAIDAQVLAYTANLSRAEACEAIYIRDGLDHLDSKTLQDDISRPHYKLSEEAIIQIIDEIRDGEQLTDPKDIIDYLLTNQ